MIKFKSYEKFKNPKDKYGNYKSSEFENLKDFLDYYYILPKCKDYTDNELKFINNNRLYFKSNTEVKGIIFFKRKTKKKRFNDEDVKRIRKEYFEDGLSYKSLSYKYKCSKATLYKILKNMY